MIEYRSFTLDNGLQVIVHEDPTVATVAVDVLYDVGSRDELPHKTGFAHLFEHLMFGGSKNIANYDIPLQQVGGSNNAFTSPDVTNYYVTLPAENIETAFWLESDRMLSLSFDPKVLEVQRKVVIEEFKQRYLDQPYGDAWLKLRPLAYKKHPYRWATIGKDISHIEEATMDDVQEFFFKYYRPSNAVLVVAGNVKYDQVAYLAEKWFGGIPYADKPIRNLPQEPEQTEARRLEKNDKVPSDLLYRVYKMCGFKDEMFHATDLLSDVLGRGNSSRLHKELVEEQRLFSNISASILGSFDPGLFVVSGRPAAGVSIEEGEKALAEVLEGVRTQVVSEEELAKVKNQAEATLVFSEVEVLNRAFSLAMATVQGDTEIVNRQAEEIQAVSPEQLHKAAQEVLAPEKANTLIYKSQV